MSLSTDLRARMQLIPSHWEQRKLYARCLTLVEAVEKLPEPLSASATFPIEFAGPLDGRLAAAVENLKEMVR